MALTGVLRPGHVAIRVLELEPALNFCRYVLWSGLIELCNQNSCSDTGLEISGANLQTRAKDLQESIQLRFVKNNKGLDIRPTELEKINHKLDLIAGRISQLSPLQTDTAKEGITQPSLQVIQGGVS